MARKSIIGCTGEIRIYGSVEEALRDLVGRGGGSLLIVEHSGELYVMHVRKLDIEPPRSVEEVASRGVAVVFDQMFKGYAAVLKREIPEADYHEIMGVGLEEPVKREGVTYWPARDDYDVIRIVERLAERSKRVVFFTGDKRLARQAESIGGGRVRVVYMPPGEFPGKEIQLSEMAKILREELI